MARKIDGSILCFALFVIAAVADESVFNQHQSLPTTNEVINGPNHLLSDQLYNCNNNKELLAKLVRLEDRLDKEMADAQGRIASLEEQNEKLTQELIDAQGAIVAMKLEVNKLSNDLLLLHQSNKRPLSAADATINRHSMRSAEGENAT